MPANHGQSEFVPGPRARVPPGSAMVELLVVVPFVLILLAAVWDLRQFIAYRADLAREMFVLAHAVANDAEGGVGGTPPLESAVRAAEERFSTRATSGVIHAVVVVRGTQRADGTACPDGDWCPPMVQVAWPGTAEEPAGTWSDGDDNPCTPTNALPARGRHFAAEQRVLPFEGATAAAGDPAPTEDEWVSRNIDDEEWWVVVDTCIEPPPGFFIGRLVNLSHRMLDTPYVWRRRAAWPSIHDREECNWCGAGT